MSNLHEQPASGPSDRTPGIRRDCECPRANHQHGTHLAYFKDGCRCGECSKAGQRAGKLTAHRTRNGTHTYVDAARARRHVVALLDRLTVSQIEQRSGVHRTSIRVLTGDFPGCPPSKRITRRTEEALLAVTPELVGSEARGLVDGTGTRRRFRALVAIGWPQKDLIRQLGMSSRTAWMLTKDDPVAPVVTVRTRDAVREAYERLSMTAPEGRWATTARNRAAARGWFPPLAWDDEKLDDPTATPSDCRPSTRRTAKASAVVENVEWLLGQGSDRVTISAQLDMTDDALHAAFARSDRLDVWQRYLRSERISQTG